MEKTQIICENEFCIYQLNGYCQLDTIEVGCLGTCDSCIVINISEAELNKKKLETISSVENTCPIIFFKSLVFIIFLCYYINASKNLEPYSFKESIVHKEVKS